MTRAVRFGLGLFIVSFPLGLFACGGGGSKSPTSPTSVTAQVVAVEVRDNLYEPRSVSIRAGDTVRWVFRGSDPTHTVTEVNQLWDSGFVFTQAGATFERRFTESDDGKTFEYSCRSHKECCQMQGSVRVGANAPAPRPGY